MSLLVDSPLAARLLLENHNDDTNDNNNNEMDLMPLYMSLIAGMSTCLGAVWVLFQKKGTVIPSSTLCFSLSLAGSVMVTVSVVSILPEVLRDEDDTIRVEGGSSFHMISFTSRKFFYRLLFHVVGYVLYFLLAKFAFPEPDEILGLQPVHADSHDVEIQSLMDSTTTTTTTTTTSTDSPPNNNRRDKGKARNRKGDASPTTRGRSNSSTSVDDHPGKELPPKSPEPCPKGRDKEKLLLDSSSWNHRWSRYSSGHDLPSKESKRAWRVALLLFVSLSVHNFPEGLAVAASAMNSTRLGWKVTIGIMVHNIPEGVSIAVPCIAARPDSPWLAFWLSALSGLAEPFGAFVAIFVLSKMDRHHPETKSDLWNMENVLSFVAGIMIMVALAELFPEAKRHTKEGNMPFIAGTVCGMVLMLATELYMEG